MMVTLPLRTPNPLNGSQAGWRAKARTRKLHRLVARQHVATAKTPSLPVDVVLTRVAPSGGLDPHDGLGAALKGVIDGIADALGIDDRDPRVTWQLAQRRGPWSVEVVVTARSQSQ